MVGDRFSSSTSCSGWLHETAPARPDPSLSCLFLKVATHPSWIPSSSRAARPPGMRPLAATVRRRPAGGCGPAPASGIQPSGMHPQPGPGCARVRRRRPAPSLRVPRSRAGSYRWPVREPRRTAAEVGWATPGIWMKSSSRSTVDDSTCGGPWTKTATSSTSWCSHGVTAGRPRGSSARYCKDKVGHLVVWSPTSCVATPRRTAP